VKNSARVKSTSLVKNILRFRKGWEKSSRRGVMGYLLRSFLCAPLLRALGGGGKDEDALTTKKKSPVEPCGHCLRPGGLVFSFKEGMNGEKQRESETGSRGYQTPGEEQKVAWEVCR